MYTQPTTEEAQKWANALRSGKYEKGMGQLKMGHKFCSIGVACDVFKKYKISFKGHILPLSMDPNSIPEWLININSDFYGKTDMPLWMINDCGYLDFKNFTFNEIADIIELVYVHRILN